MRSLLPLQATMFVLMTLIHVKSNGDENFALHEHEVPAGDYWDTITEGGGVASIFAHHLPANFTQHLHLDGMNNEEAAIIMDTDKDGQLSLEEFHMFVQPKLTNVIPPTLLPVVFPAFDILSLLRSGLSKSFSMLIMTTAASSNSRSSSTLLSPIFRPKHMMRVGMKHFFGR